MRPSIRLPEGTVVTDVADGAREAIESFLALEPGDKLALSRWLIGPYRRATRFAPRRLNPTSPSSAHGPATPLSVREIVAHVQEELGAAIDAASEPGAERLLARLPESIDVVPVHDAFGGRGFAPMDVAHVRLLERVTALLMADYLTRPDEFVAKRGPGRARRPSGRMLALG